MGSSSEAWPDKLVVDATLEDVHKQSHSIAKKKRRCEKAIDLVIYKRAIPIAQELINRKTPTQNSSPIK